MIVVAFNDDLVLVTVVASNMSMGVARRVSWEMHLIMVIAPLNNINMVSLMALRFTEGEINKKPGSLNRGKVDQSLVDKELFSYIETRYMCSPPCAAFPSSS